VGEGGGVVVQAAQALAAIEMETGDVCDGSSSDTLAKLRSLLEREVMAQVCCRTLRQECRV
jgi:dihydroxyacid dehydratase/phosphogluconate dehydratase